MKRCFHHQIWQKKLWYWKLMVPANDTCVYIIQYKEKCCWVREHKHRIGFKCLLNANDTLDMTTSQTFNIYSENRRGGVRMVVVFTTTCAISVYHHKSCEFKSRSWPGLLDTTLCDNVTCDRCAVFSWFSGFLQQ